MPRATRPIRIGTAGWSIPRALSARFPAAGTHLQRYGQVLRAAEINSCFYRAHDPRVYEKWAAATPAHFRFAVKASQRITHEHALRSARKPVEEFLRETSALGAKRGPVLVQLPPSLVLQPRIVHRFFETLRARYDGAVVLEPRHESWFGRAADRLLLEHRISRVAVDPVKIPNAGEPGGATDVVYYRLHGSPRMYWSLYDEPYLTALAHRLRAHAKNAEVWCIFDNTASGGAALNALQLQAMVAPIG